MVIRSKCKTEGQSKGSDETSGQWPQASPWSNSFHCDDCDGNPFSKAGPDGQHWRLVPYHKDGETLAVRT